MPVKRLKDMSGCVLQGKIKAAERPYYWHVYLWKDQEALLLNTAGIEREDNLKDGYDCMGCHCPVPTLLDLETMQHVPTPKLGELHFIKGAWNMEIVAHELLHALFHRIRTLCLPGFKDLSESNMVCEEVICYEYGRWVGELYRWLWKADPNLNWTKAEDHSVPSTTMD